MLSVQTRALEPASEEEEEVEEEEEKEGYFASTPSQPEIGFVVKDLGGACVQTEMKSDLFLYFEGERGGL
ncbi:hypothetical protein JZ751_022208 [Albula glossodonta]|uniref:Uncharacterized protein n=1 Tax=Albula glossodonta TaxID=121402 RepID=A0A8T2NHL1_9TELE|nr:hypothetical protein JZ751_022208 [Albula glossodonta]